MPVSGLLPPKGFEARQLVVTAVAAGGVWRRLYQSRFPDPLGYGLGPSRFSDPETTRLPPERFGVVYLGSSVKVCFLEAILRDRAVGRIQTYPIEWAELEAWTCAELRIARTLQLVDLRGDGLVRMGIPTDVARASAHDLGRAWSRAFWSHHAVPDGIMYESRLNTEINIALYDRALAKMMPVATPRLVDCRSELAAIISDFDLAIV
jgi:hypothetical protein